MRIEEKFNIKTAKLLETQGVNVDQGLHVALGVRVRFFLRNDPDSVHDPRHLSMHMTPDEALDFASQLVDAARRRLKA